MDKNYLLNSNLARILYKYVRNLPVIDYHNHLSIKDIWENRRFYDIYDLWIKPDPYKHRAMRMCGVQEKYITGDASNEEKFIKWCETVPYLIGNPLYHWSQAEVNAILEVRQLPNAKNAKKLYKKCNTYLKDNEITVKNLLEKFNVEFACPCASLVDDISLFPDNLAPSLRGDDIVSVSSNFIKELDKITNIEINDLPSFKKAVTARLEEFKAIGCCFSDHALDNGFLYYEDDGKNDERFKCALSGEIDKENREKLFSHILTFLGNEYAELGFVMQLHIGAERYTSSTLRVKVGPQGGFAGIGNGVDVTSLTKFMDTLDRGEKGFPKTVLFTLNPADNALISVLSGSYSKDGVSGLVTQGPAWWWCDHKTGIIDVLENVSAFGVLYNFIGMTTDSRSFLSFVRHDYFRRILCDWVAEKVHKGDFPNDLKTLKELVYMICYGNIKQTGGIKL